MRCHSQRLPLRRIRSSQQSVRLGGSSERKNPEGEDETTRTLALPGNLTCEPPVCYEISFFLTA